MIKISDIKIINSLNHSFEHSFNLPGSKSITLRNYVLAALADGTSRIHLPGDCDDTIRMEDSLQRLGISIQTDQTTKIIKGQRGRFASGEISLHVGLSAASTRQLIALVTLRQEKTHIDGLPPMRARPNKYLLEAISHLGATVTATDDSYLPLSIMGPKSFASAVTMPGDVSSQYFTGLLQIAPLLPKGLTIEVAGELVSKPYIDITLNEMKKFGVEVKNEDYQRFYVAPQTYQPVDLTVEGDASAASYFAALATLHGGSVTLKNLGTDTKQGDYLFLDLCEKLGAHVTYRQQSTTIVGPADGKLLPLEDEIDMEHMPDVAPTLMVIAPFIPGRTKITGLSTLRLKECDRIAVPAEHLAKLGVPVIEGADYIEIGELAPDSFRQNLSIATHDDHRMAMSFAVLGTKIGYLHIEDPACVNKTYPRFWDDLDQLYRS